MGAGFSGMYFLTPWSVWFLATPPIIDWRNRNQVSTVGILLPALMTTNNLGDTLNQDFNRILYFSLYAKQENWQVTLQNAFDLGASGRAYNSITSGREIAMWVKWATTLTIGIRF
jgi:hypothetical protein